MLQSAAVMALLAAANAFVAHSPRAFPTRSAAAAAPGVSMAAEGLHWRPVALHARSTSSAATRRRRASCPSRACTPGVSAADVRAPVASPPPEIGNWQYEFADPDGPQMGTVALPPSDLVNLCESPVVLITTHQNIGCEAPGGDNELEVLLLVDRADVEHDLDKFYVFEQSLGGERAVAGTCTRCPRAGPSRRWSRSAPVRSSMPAQAGRRSSGASSRSRGRALRAPTSP